MSAQSPDGENRRRQKLDEDNIPATRVRLTGWWFGWYVTALGYPNRFQIQSDGRTARRKMHDKGYDKELVQFGGICFFRNRDADETNLELQWNTGMFSAKEKNC